MPVNITMEFVQQLMEQNTALLKQNAVLTDQVDELTATVRELNQTIRELKEQLGKNSKNSSKPPSSDDLRKPPSDRNRSLRQKSGRKQGAQNGHDGVNLSVIAEPDYVEYHMHPDCSLCPYHDRCLEKACVMIRAGLAVRVHMMLHMVGLGYRNKILRKLASTSAMFLGCGLIL